MNPLSVWDPVKRCRVLNPKAFELEEDMAEYKTVLAPNAPWPGKPVEKPKPVAKVRRLPPPKDASKIRRTDENYKRWANNLGIKHGT